nr:nucleotidyl transferase AbiEii/AbiGii toxin family protein [Paraburkholderia elongata]
MSEATRGINTPFVVAGATARDILLWHVYGQRPDRATSDVDVAVCAVSWDAHESLIAALEATGCFKRDENAQQRLIFTDPAVGRSMPLLDLVPFGQIEQPEGSIAWPPAGETVMNVLGFQEAVDTAVEVEIHEGLAVPVVTLPALALLKILAWKDRRALTNKDASDLLVLLRNYLEAGNTERIWEVGEGLLKQHEFDLTLAACGLLGRDARAVALAATTEAIDAILTDHTTYDLLRGDVLARAAGQMFDDYADGSEDALSAFRSGFLDAR